MPLAPQHYSKDEQCKKLMILKGLQLQARRFLPYVSVQGRACERCMSDKILAALVHQGCKSVTCNIWLDADVNALQEHERR